MALDHFIQPTVPDNAAVAARLGGAQGAANQMNANDIGKFVKLVAESRYDQTAAGDAIEGAVYSVEMALQNGYAIGSVLEDARMRVTFDGSQAAGTGTVAVGDLVVAGAVEARNTPIANGYPKVRKATAQTATPFMWRVVSLGTVGTGAVGTIGVIARV